MDKEVKFISIASLIFKILAWISAAFFVIVSIIVLLGAGGDTPRIAGLVFLIGGGIYFLVLFTISVVINLIGSIAENFQNQEETVQRLGYKVDKLVSLLEGKPLA
ncbi:MAG: hypothetical protein KKD05_03915 [Candidatus Omnitrophica bacterium]|nr:hypothetical protein [Candidatus Omnitrophota bacterium]